MINASPSKPRSFFSGPRSYVVLAAFIVVGALLALPLFTGSASPTTPNDKNKITNQVNNSASSRPSVTSPGFNFLATAPFSGPATVDTFAGDCTTPKSVYNLQDTDLTVCAQFTNAVPGWQVIWSNANFVAVQTSNITTANGNATFTLN